MKYFNLKYKDFAEVRRHYHQLALKYHPDFCNREDAAQIFTEIVYEFHALSTAEEQSTEPRPSVQEVINAQNEHLNGEAEALKDLLHPLLHSPIFTYVAGGTVYIHTKMTPGIKAIYTAYNIVQKYAKYPVVIYIDSNDFGITKSQLQMVGDCWMSVHINKPRKRFGPALSFEDCGRYICIQGIGPDIYASCVQSEPYFTCLNIPYVFKIPPYNRKPTKHWKRMFLKIIDLIEGKGHFEPLKDYDNIDDVIRNISSENKVAQKFINEMRGEFFAT
jgi:hypothetical protein